MHVLKYGYKKYNLLTKFRFICICTSLELNTWDWLIYQELVSRED